MRAFQKTLAESPGPVHAHCKTGTRSAMLYAIGDILDGRMRKNDVATLGEGSGLDLSAAVKWLETNGR